MDVPATRQQIAGLSSCYDSLNFARWPVDRLALGCPPYACTRLGEAHAASIQRGATVTPVPHKIRGILSDGGVRQARVIRDGNISKSLKQAVNKII